MKTIVWEKPNGSKITTNALKATVEACKEMKWKIAEEIGEDEPKEEYSGESFSEEVSALRNEFQQAFSDGMSALRESFNEELSALRGELNEGLSALRDELSSSLSALKEEPKEEPKEEKTSPAKKKA